MRNRKKELKLPLHFLACASYVVNFLKPYAGGFARVCNPCGIFYHTVVWSGCFWLCSFQKKQLHMVLLFVDDIRRGCCFPSVNTLHPHLHCLVITVFSFRAQWVFCLGMASILPIQPGLAADNRTFKGKNILPMGGWTVHLLWDSTHRQCPAIHSRNFSSSELILLIFLITITSNFLLTSIAENIYINAWCASGQFDYKCGWVQCL